MPKKIYDYSTRSKWDLPILGLANIAIIALTAFNIIIPFAAFVLIAGLVILYVFPEIYLGFSLFGFALIYPILGRAGIDSYAATNSIVIGVTVLSCLFLYLKRELIINVKFSPVDILILIFYLYIALRYPFAYNHRLASEKLFSWTFTGLFPFFVLSFMLNPKHLDRIPKYVIFIGFILLAQVLFFYFSQGVQQYERFAGGTGAVILGRVLGLLTLLLFLEIFRTKTLFRGFYAFFCFVAFSILIMTATRSTTIAIATTIFFIIFFFTELKLSTKIASLGITAVLSSLFILVGGDYIIKRFVSAANSTTEFSASHRLQLATEALQNIWNKPVFGYGISGSSSVFGVFMKSFGYGHSHIAMLDLMVEQGIVGVILYLSIMLTALFFVYKVIRNKKHSYFFTFGVIVFLYSGQVMMLADPIYGRYMLWTSLGVISYFMKNRELFKDNNA